MRPFPKRCFAFFVVAGLCERLLGGVYSVAIAHPDEHQQYLEVAQKLAFGGPAIEFWEQARGMRNLFYPYLLAGILRVAQALGLDEPLGQGAVLRVMLALAVFSLFAKLCARLVREGQTRLGLSALGLFALLPSFVYLNVRCLSENAMTIPLLGALLCLPKRPGAAGLCLGIMFAVRFQSAFVALGIFGIALYDDIVSWKGAAARPSLRQLWHDGQSLRMSAGALLAILLFVGLLDKLTLGGWFHSPIEYLEANIIENKAAAWGTSPWYQYLIWTSAAVWHAAFFAALLLVFGLRRGWRWFVPALAMLLGHSLVGHKEPRFIWGVAPLMVLVAAAGFEAGWDALGKWTPRPSTARLLYSALTLSCLVVGAFVTWPGIPWTKAPYTDSAYALDYIRRRPDVRGVAVVNLRPWLAGNYFYLRRSVPLLFPKKPLERRQAREINYVLANRREPSALSQLLRLKRGDRWEGPLFVYGRSSVYRLRRETPNHAREALH